MAKTKRKYALNRTKYLLDDEYHRLVQILSSFEIKDPRNVDLLELALSTGARASELLALSYADLNSNDSSVYIHGSKGSNDRELPIKDSLFRRLNSHRKETISDGGVSNVKIFDISYSRLRQIWELYRPVPKKFHSLRHTFAIRLYKKAKDIRLVQYALGHRNINNTMIYAEYVYSQEELRKLIL